MIKTLIFATDLCVHTPYLLQHVLTLAHGLCARIIVVHAVEPLGSLGTAMVNTFLPAETQQQGLQVLTTHVRERILDLLTEEFADNNLKMGQVAEVVVEAGKPAEVILEQVKRKQADLIVMGSRGPEEREVSGRLGSVTSRVLQRTRVPVYTIPMLGRRWRKDEAGSSTAESAG